MREFTEQEQVRREKAENIKKLGLDPFGQKFERTGYAKEINQGKPEWLVTLSRPRLGHSTLALEPATPSVPTVCSPGPRRLKRTLFRPGTLTWVGEGSGPLCSRAGWHSEPVASGNEGQSSLSSLISTRRAES